MGGRGVVVLGEADEEFALFVVGGYSEGGGGGGGGYEGGGFAAAGGGAEGESCWGQQT